jgi:hypothetical protein
METIEGDHHRLLQNEVTLTLLQYGGDMFHQAEGLVPGHLIRSSSHETLTVNIGSLTMVTHLSSKKQVPPLLLLIISMYFY